MREGKPSPRFGHRGLRTISLGSGSTPMLLRLYDADDNVLAEITEIKGKCLDPGHVDFFLGPNCRPSQHEYLLVERLPGDITNVLHSEPKKLAMDFSAWVGFLDEWISKFETKTPRQA